VNTNLSIAAIAHRWGFCDASHLGREFRRHFSLSPGDYREAHGTHRTLKLVSAVDVDVRQPRTAR
jgi:transcriptional regulator GlxA family with amidase domain